MAEYIERDKALEEFDEWAECTGVLPKGTAYYAECRGCIEDVPAADVAPVVHGRWEPCFEDWRKEIDGDRCSACGFEHYPRRAAIKQQVKEGKSNG